MKLTYLIICTFAVLFLQSCNSDENNQKTEKTEDLSAYKDEKEFEEKISSIDNNTGLQVIRSLAFNNNEGSQCQAIAYLDKNNNEVKIEEKYSDAKTGNYGTNTFYIENGKKFASKEVYLDNGMKDPQFIERVSYYDENGKVEYTKERMATFEIDLPQASFQSAKEKDLSIERSMEMLNMEGSFETTFQGFVEDGSLRYILVGENTPEGYVSSLAIQYEDATIKKLSNNEKAMVGTPLEVEFQTAVDEREMQFQLLIAIKIK